MVSKIKYALILLLFATHAWAGTSYYIGSTAVATYGANPGFATYEAFETAVSPTTGDDLYFERDESHYMSGVYIQILINWTGTSGDRVIVGAWGTGADPIIDGQDIYPAGSACTDGMLCWSALIQVTSVDYVTIQNLNVKNAEGYLISASWADYLTVDSCTLSNSYRQAFAVNYCDNGLFTNNTASDFARRLIEQQTNPGSPSNGGITLNHTSYNWEMSGNYIYNSRGEGFAANNGSHSVVMKNNRAEGINRAFFVERGYDVTIRNNLVLVPSSGLPMPRSGTWGIGITEEGWSNAYNGVVNNVLVYGNIIVNAGAGIVLVVAQESSNFTNVRIFNNSIIGCDTSFQISSRLGVDWSGSTAKNNISWPLVRHTGVWNAAGGFSGLTVGPNMWSSNVTIPITIFRHANDIYQAPDLAMSGQGGNVAYNTLLVSDLALDDGSAGIGVGEDLSAIFTELFLATDTDPTSPTLSTVSTWDYGAVDYASGSVPSTETACNDSVDNDNDSYIDCDDPDCYPEDFCEQPESTCDDNFDNDGDGDIDCLAGIQDSDCSCSAPTVGNQPYITGGRSN